MERSENILYRESQIFSHSLVWLGVLCITFGSIYFGLPPLFEVASDMAPAVGTVVGSIVFLSAGMILPILLFIIKLKIQVRTDGIYIKIIPFQITFRKISLDDLINCESYDHLEKTENKLGLKHLLTKNTYSLGGKRGIKLDFKGGKTIFIESKRQEKIIKAIRNASTQNL